MALRRVLLALVWTLLASGAANAEDWTFRSLEGSARSFASAEWSIPQVGATLTPNMLVQTEADGRLRLARGADWLDLGPATKIRVEDQPSTLVRAFEGALGVNAAGTGLFRALSTYAAVETSGANFGLVCESNGATIAVRQGLVSVTDLTTRKTYDVRAGQILRLRRGQSAVAQTAKGDEPAMAAAGGAPPDAASIPPKLDRNATGAIKPNAKLAEDAADAVHDQKRKAKLGKADPRAVAAAGRIARDLFEPFDVEMEPWDDSFQWTQVEEGEVRLKPIWRIVAGLKGAESYEFWFLAFAVCLFLGGVASATLEKAGFGLPVNTLLVMLAFAAAILVRDAFFRSGANIAVEPFLSVGLMLGAMPLFLVGCAFARLRLP